MLKLKPSRWGNYENGVSQPYLNVFSDIAKYFGVNEHDLLNIDLSKNVHLIKKNKNGDNQKNVLLNVNRHVHLIHQKPAYSQDSHITLAAEPEVNITKHKQGHLPTDITAEVLVLKDNQTIFNRRLKIMEAQVNNLIKKLK